jgi:tRNA-Thr(GGU) m(6)t(6)A37 methyltransferase TsaA
MKKIECNPIGIIQTPFKETKGMPIQSAFSKAAGKVILSKEFLKAIKGLEGFSHLILIYHFHNAKKQAQIVKPFLSDQEFGIFAVRAPNRPNSIGISIVRLIDIIVQANSIELIIDGVDMLDQTPLLDIKPYIKDYDSVPDAKCGWYDEREIETAVADDRFSKI